MICSNGVGAPTATDTVLNMGDLEDLLASGSVEVTTTGSGVQANNIDVDAPLSWSSAHALALDAYESIAVGTKVSVQDRGGPTLMTKDGGSGVVFSISGKGDAVFQNLSSQVTINGTSFILVDSVGSVLI